MFWRQKTGLDRKQLLSFIYSFAIHGVVALTLIFSGPATPDEPNEILVNLISSNDAPLKTQGSSLAPQQKRPTKQSSKLHSKDKTSVDKIAEEPQKADLAMGESDVEASPQGRAPDTVAERYLAEIRDQISQQQTYPAVSRSFREEGTVRIRLTLNRSGSIVKIELIEGSPFKRLNDAAMRAAARAAPFKPFPTEIGFETWQVSLPVRFTLARN